MVVELAAVRALAPWFGASLVVWTNVIAVILLALALGYILGGRWASSLLPERVLSRVLLFSGLLVAWAPFLATWFARTLMPAELALHQAAGLVKWGSLAISLLVFLPPAVLLGMACPLAVEVLSRARQMPPGAAGGAVLFASTLGSLVGVFGTSHVLLPQIGVQGTFLLSSAMLFVAGLLAWARSRGKRTSGYVPMVVLVAGGASSFFSPEPRRLGFKAFELARRESPYQALRVIEDRSGEEALRVLQVNEGFDSFQSVWQASEGCLPDGYYYNDFLLPLSWSSTEQPWRVLVLGMGAGTVVRVFGGEPNLCARFTGVELDPAVIAIGREFFQLGPDGPGLRVLAGVDARVALRVEEGPFDQIVLDCYANQVEIPPHLCTLEFFRELKSKLADDGWLTANLGGFGFEDPVVSAVANTCASAFESPVMLLRVPKARNFMLLARRAGKLPWTGASLAPAERESSLRLGPRLLPGFAKIVLPSSERLILSDDHCPIEVLQGQSISRAGETRTTRGDA